MGDTDELLAYVVDARSVVFRSGNNFRIIRFGMSVKNFFVIY